MARAAATATRRAATRLSRLAAVVNRYGPGLATRKVALIAGLAALPLRSPRALRRLHDLLAFLRAFPDDRQVHAAAEAALAGVGARVAALPRAARAALQDSGIAGTVVRYPYNHANAAFLAVAHGERVEIDWRAWEEPGWLDALLANVVELAEQQGFEDADHTRAWIDRARAGSGATAFAWVLRQCGQPGLPARVWAQHYDAAEVPVTWELADSAAATTHNRLRVPRVVFRERLRRAPDDPVAAIARPLRGIRHLSRAQGRRLLAVAQQALLVRHREVYHFQHGDPAAVYLADAGHGTAVAIVGVRGEHRLPVEANFGHMIFANGVPFGYGGVSPLFHQANTGVSVFEEFRGAEAAALYAQVLRAARTLFGCTRFVVNPYQFGADNDDALASGAFWFYWRLGFRPVRPDLLALAQSEAAKIAARRGYRTPLARLRRLAADDIHLDLPGARPEAFFPEQWLRVLGEAVTDHLATHGNVPRHRAMVAMHAHVAARLGVRDRRHWPAAERDSFARLAPLLALVPDLGDWSRAERRALVRLMRAKGATTELAYARLLRAHERLRATLADVCRARA